MSSIIKLKGQEGKGAYFDLEIDESHDGPRDRSMVPRELRHESAGELTEEGGVVFRTKAGKAWFIKFSEFSFVVNQAREPKAA